MKILNIDQKHGEISVKTESLNDLWSLYNIINKDESFLGVLPSLDITPNPNRAVNPDILRKILRAISEKKSLEIEYQSMSRDNPMWRRISPHTLAYDGHRWHVHGYCFIRKSFRDFLPVKTPSGLKISNMYSPGLAPVS